MRYHLFRTTPYSYGYLPMGIAMLMLAAAFEIQGFTIFAVSAFLVAAGMLTGHYGYEIDIQLKQERVYLSYLWIKFGAWKELPGYDRITIRRFRYNTDSGLTWKTVGHVHYTIYLFSGKQADALAVYRTGDLKAAQQTAKKLSAVLGNIEVVED